MTTIQEFQKLIVGYKENQQKNMSSSVGIQEFSDLLSRFKITREETERKALHTASDFNIFDILWLSDDELRHSAFLRSLLDPQGSHGQGLLFLKSFFKMCSEAEPNTTVYQSIIENINQGHWQAWREHSTKYGRMDIVLLNQALGALVVIENKIKAYEQADQLKNYSRWIETMHREFPYRTLIFLTPSGYQSVTAGMCDYLRLSFKQDIYSWLGNTLPDIQAPIVTATVQQYLNLISNL